MTTKIALVQLNSIPGAIAENLQKIVDYSKQAANQGATVVLFHEGTLTDYVADALALSEEVPTGNACTVIKNLANGLSIYISFGLLEKQGTNVFITQVFFGPDNFFYKYRKTNLHTPKDVEAAQKRHRDETRYLTAGTGPEIFYINGIKASCIICADKNSPEVLEQLKALQPQLVFFPNNRVRWRPDEYWAEVATITNAPVLVTNRVGESWGFSSTGGTAAYLPNGTCVARANTNGDEEIIYVTTKELGLE